MPNNKLIIMYLETYKNKRGTDIVFWCKPFTIKLHISPRRCWKTRKDNRKPRVVKFMGLNVLKIRKGIKW